MTAALVAVSLAIGAFHGGCRAVNVGKVQAPWGSCALFASFNSLVLVGSMLWVTCQLHRGYETQYWHDRRAIKQLTGEASRGRRKRFEQGEAGLVVLPQYYLLTQVASLWFLLQAIVWQTDSHSGIGKDVIFALCNTLDNYILLIYIGPFTTQYGTRAVAGAVAILTGIGSYLLVTFILPQTPTCEWCQVDTHTLAVCLYTQSVYPILETRYFPDAKIAKYK